MPGREGRCAASHHLSGIGFGAAGWLLGFVRRRLTAILYELGRACSWSRIGSVVGDRVFGA